MKLPFPHTRQAFTLVEVLVAMTVLVLLVSLVSSITNNATRSITNSGSRVASDSEARALFNRMAIDLSRMLRRADLNYPFMKQSASDQLGNDKMAFFSEVQGYPENATTTINQLSPYSKIAYMLLRPTTGNFFPGTVLYRGADAMPWDAPLQASELPDPAPSSGVPDYRSAVAGSQTFRMEYTYLLKADANNPARLSSTPGSGMQNVDAIVVAIAVLDEKARAMASSGDMQWADTDLVSALRDVADSNTPIAEWNTALSDLTTFASSAKIPRRVAVDVRLYQRYFYLNQ